MKPHNLWPKFGISDAELEERADWIRRDHRGFPGTTVMYFRTAASLIRFSKYDFTLVSLALFQVVIGLEKIVELKRACSSA